MIPKPTRNARWAQTLGAAMAVTFGLLSFVLVYLLGVLVVVLG